MLNSIFSKNITRIDMPRGVFPIKNTHKTAFNATWVVPLYYKEVIPGEDDVLKCSFVLRTPTPIVPVMDNLFLDLYAFYVPYRILWTDFVQLMGENKNAPWANNNTYTVPQVTAPAGGWQTGTLADYLGIPVGVEGISVSALPFRAYTQIWNDWFRNENFSSPAQLFTDGVTRQGSNSFDNNTVQLGSSCLWANRFYDYFSSCLPAPQKHAPVVLPLGESAVVKTSSDTLLSGTQPAMTLGPAPLSDIPDFSYLGISKASSFYSTYASDKNTATTPDISGTQPLYPNNLYADLSSASTVTVNDLRLAFQLQKLYERDARGGTRYTEMLQSHFGVKIADSTLQRSEFLGGKRIPLNMEQVLQTSQDTTDSNLGATGAYSLTGSRDITLAVKGFKEFGSIMVLGVVRPEHTYQQGLAKFWSRKTRTDFYFPVFANIGETPVYKREIFATGTDTDNEPWGYNEPWADYRYMPSYVTSQFRSNLTSTQHGGTHWTTLDYWHYADKYSSVPSLNPSWLQQGEASLNRTLSIQSPTTAQFFGDFFFDNKVVMPMPIDSYPGLVDHH